MELLRVQGLTKHFGGVAALSGVDLAVTAGERRAIIGPNGAGKTTLFNLVTGLVRPTAGRVLFQRRDVTALPPERLAGLGLSRTFQKTNLFAGLAVFENVRLAAQRRAGIDRRLLRPAETFGEVNREVEEILKRLGLREKAGLPARDLSYGEQRQLEIAIALATRPQVLLLDEPTSGMSPAETGEMVRLLAELPRALTLLIIEHDMDVVFALADGITVLYNGEILVEGPPDQVKGDLRVRDVYLGVERYGRFLAPGTR